jgi:dGTPase
MIYRRNVSLQVLDGILCHNGEIELNEYRPKANLDFAQYDRDVEACYTDKEANKRMISGTLEGCVMRISDIIAYIGKDRQDATRAKVIEGDSVFSEGKLGRFNASIINNLIVNVIENSFDKDYIMVDPEYFEELKLAMKENYKHIYMNESVKKVQDELISPMYEKLFSKLLSELKTRDENSLVFKHHISYVNRIRSYYSDTDYFEQNSPEEIVIDYISSMTDDYFSDLYGMYFPHDVKPQYHSYFAD